MWVSNNPCQSHVQLRAHLISEWCCCQRLFHGYVVRVGQFLKFQVSDGRARDYLAVAFQYFVGQCRYYINSRSQPTPHVKLSLREIGLWVIKHNPFIKFKFTYVADVSRHAIHFGFRGLVVKVKTILEYSSRQWSQSFLGTLRFRIFLVEPHFNSRISPSHKFIQGECGSICFLWHPASRSLRAKSPRFCSLDPSMIISGGTPSCINRRSRENGVSLFFCHGYGTGPTIGCYKHLCKLVAVLGRGTSKQCVSKHGAG